MLLQAINYVKEFYCMVIHKLMTKISLLVPVNAFLLFSIGVPQVNKTTLNEIAVVSVVITRTEKYKHKFAFKGFMRFTLLAETSCLANQITTVSPAWNWKDWKIFIWQNLSFIRGDAYHFPVSYLWLICDCFPQKTYLRYSKYPSSWSCCNKRNMHNAFAADAQKRKYVASYLIIPHRIPRITKWMPDM